jgi:hypothetical protein
MVALLVLLTQAEVVVVQVAILVMVGLGQFIVKPIHVRANPEQAVVAEAVMRLVLVRHLAAGVVV